MEHLDCYDVLWQLIDAEVQGLDLFGERCGSLARQAFAASACGAEMPIVYLEVPLSGEPGFDLQVCIERTSLRKGFVLPSDAPKREQELLTWLTGPQGASCTGVDLAFDLRAQDMLSPQLIVLMNRGILDDAESFFALAGAPDGASRYRAAEERMPHGWNSWYTGIIPGRPGAPVRLDFFVDRPKARSYAKDVSLLAQDLGQMGYELSGREASWCEQLLQIPCDLNLQLDALSDGSIGPVLGYNLIEGNIGPQATKKRLESGWMRQVMQMAEAWGLADERWQQLKGLCQGRMLVRSDIDATKTTLVVKMKPTFIKIRMTQEALVDAKAYVICTIDQLGPKA